MVFPYNTFIVEMLQQPIESAQYASAEHQALLAKHGLVGSMSRKGNCWDTQYKISLSTAFDLTRAGIGIMPLY